MQRLPGGLIFNAAKDRRRPVEEGVGIEVAGPAIGVIAIAVAVFDLTERVGDVTAAAEIAPSQTKTEVERPPGFAGRDKFAVKQAGTAEVAYAHR